MNLGGIIYVRAEPNVCAERVTIRGREGETIPIEYLEKCHQYHEDWLKDNIVNKLTIEANIDTCTKENAHIREDWIKQIDDWMLNELHIRECNKDVTTCPGCSPRFEENQLAHMGPNGCCLETTDN
jgi:hypothetical protein